MLSTVVHATASRDPRIRAFAAALKLSPAAAVGYYVALGGFLAWQDRQDGRIADLPDDLLAEAATWPGRRARFAVAVREYLQTSDGALYGWVALNAGRIRRVALHRDRMRERRERKARVRTVHGTGHDRT